MDEEEKIAQKYLTSCGYQGIRYEPDGNFPPDFLVNRKIAVEVRRLNQYYDGVEHLEGLQFSLEPKLKNLLNEFKGNQHNSSVFVSIRYSRPMCDVDVHIDKIRDILKNCPSKIEIPVEHKISDSMVLRIAPSSKKLEERYKIGSLFDMDVGGFVISEVYEAIKIAIKEKTNKIAPYRRNYGEWWLALVNRINELTEDELQQLKALPFPEHDFDKVILIPPHNPEQASFII